METKYRWETIDIISLFPLIGVNHRQPIIKTHNIMVYLYSTDEKTNQFAIGYMINPSLHTNRVFREQVEKLLRAKFHENTM